MAIMTSWLSPLRQSNDVIQIFPFKQ